MLKRLLEKFKFTAAQTEIDDAHELMDQYEEELSASSNSSGRHYKLT